MVVVDGAVRVADVAAVFDAVLAAVEAAPDLVAEVGDVEVPEAKGNEPRFSVPFIVAVP